MSQILITDLNKRNLIQIYKSLEQITTNRVREKRLKKSILCSIKYPTKKMIAMDTIVRPKY